MKKLTIAAAAAAMSVATFAATAPQAQVYDVSLTIKTTKAAQATIKSAKINPFVEVDAVLVYRTQTSITWKGLIWGCNCESIDGIWENAKYTIYDQTTGDCDDGVACTVKGCVIWDTKGKAPVYFGNGADITDPATAAGCGFGWTFLQMIGKDAKSLECSWDISSAGDQCGLDEVFRFVGSGFGKAKFVSSSYTYEDEDGKKVVVTLPYSCANNVNSISGNFAGWMAAPFDDVTSTWGCSFCGGGQTFSCSRATAWAWCENGAECATCGLANSLFDEDRTAAYGTWSIKYNSSLSKKLTNAYTIRDAYNFKSLPLVAEAIETAEKAANDFVKGLAAAKQNLVAAEANVVSKAKDLADAEDDAETKLAAVHVASANEANAAKQLDASTLVYAAYNESLVYPYSTENYNLAKISYTAQGFGIWEGPKTYFADVTNKLVAGVKVEAAKAVAAYATTNLVPAAEAELVTAKAGVVAAGVALKAAQEAYDQCKGKGVCE